MDFLKLVAVNIFLFVSAVAYSQTEDAIIECFQKSYKLENGGKYAAAIDELKKVKADTYMINVRLGWLSYLAGEYKKATEYYAKAISLRPRSIEARLGYVLPAAKLKAWKNVGDQYDAILSIDPGNYKANYYRGLMYYNQSNYTKASTYINKLEELYPFDYDAVILAAWTTFHLNNKQKAKLLFIQAKTIQPASESAAEGLKMCR